MTAHPRPRRARREPATEARAIIRAWVIDQGTWKVRRFLQRRGLHMSHGTPVTDDTILAWALGTGPRMSAGKARNIIKAAPFFRVWLGLDKPQQVDPPVTNSATTSARIG
jgi:hypothetical protein